MAAVYGGQDYQVQFRQLDRGVHVIVGTPGRVMDHMRRGRSSSTRLSTLVLDEADEMLRMGFAEDVEWVLTQCPSPRGRPPCSRPRCRHRFAASHRNT